MATEWWQCPQQLEVDGTLIGRTWLSGMLMWESGPLPTVLQIVP